MTTPRPVLIAEPTTVPLKPSVLAPGPQVLCPPVGGPVMLYNNDLSNVVYVGYRPEVNAQNGTPIQPLTPIVIDGSRQIYGYNPAANTILINVTPGGTYQAPSAAQIASQIAAGGVFLNTKSTKVDTEIGLVIAAGATHNRAAVSVAQVGYEFYVDLANNSASLYPLTSITFTWSDSGTGLIVEVVTWNLMGGSPGVQKYVIKGPSKADTLSLSFVNNDTVNSVTVNWLLLQNSRDYIADRIRQNTVAAVPNFTKGSVDPFSNFLLQMAPSVGASGGAIRWLPAYNGLIQVWGTGTLPFDISIQAIDPGISTAPAGNQIAEFHNTNAAGGFISGTAYLPRSNGTITVTNNSTTTSQTIGATVTIGEQEA